MASALAYPLQVSVARRAAERLAAYLADPRFRRPLRLRFVAHSLGCLVTLETVRLLNAAAATHDITVDAIILMAAAVPQGLCHPGFEPFGRQAGRVATDRVLFSVSDKVLGFAFRLGQRGAEAFGWAETPMFESWHNRRAVGREGGPHGRWELSAMPGFDHGHYWTSSDAHDEIASTMPRAAGRLERRRPPAYAVAARVPDTRTPDTRRPPRVGGAGVDWRAESDPRWQ